MAGRLRLVALSIIVVLSIAGLATAASSTASTSEPGVVFEAQTESDDGVLGRACGIWHNETIDVDQSGGLDEDDLDDLVCRTMARVEHVRGLHFQESVPVSVQSREEFKADAQNQSVDPELRTFDNAKFEAMFLVNQSTDSIDVQDSNRGASVLGYYSPSAGEIVLVAENESAVRVDEITLAHELVHALQDQHYGLSDFRGETRDEVNARNGLVEGEARYVEHRYRDGRCLDEDHAWNGTCVWPEDDGAVSGELANYGVYSLMYQPYSDGPAFVSHLLSEGGWAAVDAAYDDPPRSAAQVIHPERYPDEPPVNVSLSDRTSDEWERVRPPGRPDYATVGQTGVASMIVYPMYHSEGSTRIVHPRTWLNYTASGEISTFDPLNYGFDSAEGWAGDRMHVYRNDDNETAYVWRIEWDSDEDADEFLADYNHVMHYWGGERVRPGLYSFNDTAFGDAIRVSHENATLTIVSAPSIDELPAVRNESLPPANATIEGEWPGSSTGGNATDLSDIPVPEHPGFGPAIAVVAILLWVALVARFGLE